MAISSGKEVKGLAINGVSLGMTREEVIARRGEPGGDGPVLTFGSEPGFFGYSNFTVLKLDADNRVCGVAGANLEQDGDPVAEEAWAAEEDMKNLNKVLAG